ncbi:hypothetical protein [Pararcticibacter amylolyticus]|uniref:Uncharacterized protein n=1 Tax=Pararcticibacter amylolyticus TaxID=2173175 RepID=A0A2U2PKR1_9SPHI|nr:hypothetical protein [Pararcticibacter amylolyticus]PWG81749.1 hypothetical protein DDR33_05130 [Pararcticibacter amylolyticus]
MEKFRIEIQEGNATIPFEIVDYAHDDNNQCKFEVFKEGNFIASFEPDSRGLLHVCKNTGSVSEHILHMLADRIERFNF